MTAETSQGPPDPDEWYPNMLWFDRCLKETLEKKECRGGGGYSIHV